MAKARVELDVNGLDPNRWRALFVIAIASLMVVLDASIVNIALPSAQAELGISDANRQWVYQRRTHHAFSGRYDAHYVSLYFIHVIGRTGWRHTQYMA